MDVIKWLLNIFVEGVFVYGIMMVYLAIRFLLFGDCNNASPFETIIVLFVAIGIAEKCGGVLFGKKKM